MIPQDSFLWDSGINESIREVAEPTVPLFEVLTHLGDGAFLLVLGVLIYWFGVRSSRRERAFVIAVGTAALALSAGIKGIVQLPRPDLAFSVAGYPGYSFPSAHAVGSAAFYGALAVTMTRGRPIWRYCLAVVLVAVISLSRVLMGLHYVGDVLVGAFLGFALVRIGVWFRREDRLDPGPMFVLATFTAGSAALLGSRVFVSLTIGASLGGALGWYYVRGRPTTSSGAAVLVLGTGAIAGIGVIRFLSAQFGVTALVRANSPVFFLIESAGYTILTAFVLIVPWLAIRIETHPTVRYLQAALPFRGTVIEPNSGDSPDEK